MIIDTEKIESLLKSKVSGDRIEFETGIKKMAIWNYKNGKSKIENMTLNVAKKLCDFWDHEQNKEQVGIKVKGVKSAVGDFNNWRGSARIYFDKKELKVWCMVYGEPEQWNEYQDENVVEILNKATKNILSRDDKTTMQQIKDLCFEALKNK